MNPATRTTSFGTPVRVMVLRAVLGLLVAFLTVISLRYGTYPVTNAQIIGLFFAEPDPVLHMIVIDNRLARILAAIGAGAAFGLAGTLFQTMLRNPLASPDWIGFTPGASFGALLAIYLTGGYVLFGALIGIAITAAIVLCLALDGGLNIRKLIVIGIGANLSIAAASDLLLSRVDAMTAADMTKWLVGSLNGRDWSDVSLIWGGLAVLVPMTVMVAFPLRSLMISDDVARSHGVSLTLSRILITVVAVALVSLGVSVAGPLPFVAFLAGPIAKGLEARARPALPTAALVGAILVLSADYLSRLTPLIQLPTGVFTALIGAPFLLYLIVALSRKGKI